MSNPQIAGIEIRIDNLKKSGPLFYGWVAGLCVMVLVALYAFYFQLTNGFIVTGLQDSFPWGLYIQNFIYLVGLAAGGLVTYSSVHLFGAHKFEPITRIAVIQSAVCVMMAALFILTDVGLPQRVANFILSPNAKSIFIYDALVLNLYLVLNIVDIWVMITGKGGEKLALTMTLISLPAAFGLHSITAWILGMAKARILWHTALMPPLFLSSAIASGMAALILLVLVIQKVTDMKFKDDMFHTLAKLLSTIMIVDLFFLFVEIMTTFWPTSATPEHTSRLALFFTGKYAPIFIPEITLFGIVPFLLLAIPKTRKMRPALITACIFEVIGIFCKRFVLLAMGFGISPIGHFENTYIPTILEITVVLGVWAIGALIMTFAVKLLPLEVPESHGHGGHGHEEHIEEEQQPVSAQDVEYI